MSPRGLAFLLPLLLTLACTSRCKPYTPRYVFIDGGAHLGETVLGFEKSQLFRKYPWQVVSFEPNPDLSRQIPKRPFLTVMQNAIWNATTELEFHVSPQLTLGGSAAPSYIRDSETKAIKVKAIDFGSWLKENYRKEDVIYVKLDIEGAEYPVLEKMLRDGSMKWVDKLYIEFHGAQQAQAQGRPASELQNAQMKDFELIEAVTGLGVPVSIHHTEEQQGDYFRYNPENYGQQW